MKEKEQGHTRCWISLGATKMNDVQMQFINFCLEHIVYSNVLSFLKHDRSIGAHHAKRFTIYCSNLEIGFK